MDEGDKGIGYFAEDNGNKSWMRAMCFVALLTSMGLAVLTLLVDDSANGVYLTLMFLVAAFAPKAVQKFAETKIK